MAITSLAAHFDGEQILLDQPFPLEPNAKLRVLVMPSSSELDAEREDWLRLALQAAERAYGDDEPEYTLDDIKVPNPEYAPHR